MTAKKASNTKVRNKATSHLSENEKQQTYLKARTQEWYDNIWKTVGKCVFCDLKDKYILLEENGIALTINIYPYSDGHLMAIPRRHVRSPKELSQLEWETMRKFTYIAKRMMKKAHGQNKMWTLIREGGPDAQMTVTDHLHMQLIPFTRSDLCKWDYDELKFTPLENVQKYKDIAKEIIKTDYKFQTQYENKVELPIVCDLIITNKKKQVLFQERKKEFAYENNIITLPGGHIDEVHKSLEDGLLDEIKDELNLKVEQSKLKLIASQIGTLKRFPISKYLKTKTIKIDRFIWNTYLLQEAVAAKSLKAGDECEKILWLDAEQIAKSKRVTKEVKERIKKALIMNN